MMPVWSKRLDWQRAGIDFTAPLSFISQAALQRLVDAAGWSEWLTLDRIGGKDRRLPYDSAWALVAERQNCHEMRRGEIRLMAERLRLGLVRLSWRSGLFAVDFDERRLYAHTASTDGQIMVIWRCLPDLIKTHAGQT